MKDEFKVAATGLSSIQASERGARAQSQRCSGSTAKLVPESRTSRHASFMT